MSQLVDPSGQIVVLGAKIGSGGEGIVFDVAGRPDKVAKIYHNPLTSERAAKISAMPAIGNYEIESVCAWPSSLLSQGQKPVGFLMPRVPASDELHVLHGPKSRKLKYPNATFGYLVHVALNIARAFAVLHKNGIVAGDVNERGILAGHDGTVRLIDCDSFQILTPKRAFLCDVGVPYFTPPELQGQHLRGLQRTPNHDNFGLAVTIFLLLFMGRHPFAGRYRNGPIELDVAIKEYRFAYSADQQRTLMIPPPNTLEPVSNAGSTLAAMFEQAFSPSSSAGAGRPTAIEWINGLAALKAGLVGCQWNKAHDYMRGLASCPWCELEQNAGIDLFNFVDTGTGAASEIDVEAIWSALGALRVPPVPKPLTEDLIRNVSGTPLPTGVRTLSETLRIRLEEAKRAHAVVSTSQLEAVLLHVDAERKAEGIANTHPDVGQIQRTLNRRRDGYLISSEFLVTWLVAAALIAVPGEASHALRTFGLAIILASIPALVLAANNRKIAVDRLSGKLATARTLAVEADPEASRTISDIRNAAAAAAETATRALAVAEALDADAEAIRAAVDRELDALRSVSEITLQAAEGDTLKAKHAINDLRSKSQEIQAALDIRRRVLATSLDKWRKVKLHRDAALKKLRDDDKQNQLQSFLDTFFIVNADITGITPALKAALASFGIETAADVETDRVLSVQGFGPRRTDRMIKWRQDHERQFKYKPGQAMDPAKAKTIQARFSTDRRRLVRDFEVSLTDFRRRIDEISPAISPAVAAFGDAFRRVAQARADQRILEMHRTC